MPEKITREPLPPCNLDYVEPDHTEKCGLQSVAKWTFPHGTIFYACEDHDLDLQDAYVGIRECEVPDA